MVHYVSRGAAATRADEATPLRGRDADADRASRTAHRARVAFGVGAAGLALVGLGSFTGALTERPTTTTTTTMMSLLGQGGSDLAPGTYLVQGGYQRQKNRAESAWCRWSDGNGYNGMNGFRCAGHCDADWPHAGDKAETIEIGAVNDADGNDSGYRTIKRVAPDSGGESWCVTDKHNERGRGWPGFKKRFILCDKQKTSDDDYGTPGKFEIKSIGNGLHGIKSLDWGAFCHDKGGKAECAYPGTLNPHAKWRFIHVNDTANYFDSCPSDSA